MVEYTKETQQALDSAKDMLNYYLNLIYEKASGKSFNSDNEAEIGSALENLLDAAVAQAKHEIREELKASAQLPA